MKKKRNLSRKRHEREEKCKTQEMKKKMLVKDKKENEEKGEIYVAKTRKQERKCKTLEIIE